MEKQGFSLVELSIVLVILGLLTGGILTGQNLIRAAELRSVTTEFQTYQTAVHTFRDKYFALPGDMTNATDFWGAMSNCGAASPSGTGTETCNGDGNGIIAGAASGAGQTGELFGFWQHLANAGLIEGSYNGIAGTDADTSIVGENVPPSKMGNAGWSIAGNDAAYAGDASRYAMDYGNFFLFGNAASAAPTLAKALSPEEAWNIDMKVDDGKPGQGKIIARFWDNQCADAASKSDYESSYRLIDTTVQCALYFRKAF